MDAEGASGRLGRMVACAGALILGAATVCAVVASSLGLAAGTASAASAPPPAPVVGATAAVVYDPDTGQVLYAKDPNARLAPASTTKLMTALVVLRRHVPLSLEVRVTSADIAVGGSTAPLVAGERITVKNLLYGLLLVSGNDAAMALAQATAGSVPAFVAMMNREARKLGAGRTHFVNPDGLPAPGHLTTAADLAKIAAAAMAQPQIRRVLATKIYPFPDPSDPGTSPMVNQDQLLWSFPGMVGGKIGYTVAAGETMAAEARHGGMTLVAVILHDNYAGLFADPRALLFWGFAGFHRVRVVARGQVLARVPVAGRPHDKVAVVAGRALWRDLARNDPAGPPSVNLPRRLPARSPAGQGVGVVMAAMGPGQPGAVAAVLGANTPSGPAPRRSVPLAAWLAVASAILVTAAWMVSRRRSRRRPRYRIRRPARLRRLN